jgi:hypothetical protein
VASTQLIGVDDACRGLETPDGRVFPVNGNVAELPAAEAKNFLDSGAPNLHRHRRIRVGWSPRFERGYELAFGKGDND